jgi:hypothetical protein
MQQQPSGGGGQQQQQQNPFASPQRPQQQQRQRDPWPAAMFSLQPSSSSNPGSHHHQQQQQQQFPRGMAGFSSSGRGPDTSSQISTTNLMPNMGLSGGGMMSAGTAAAAAAAAAGDPTTPVGSPVRANRAGMGSAAGPGSAANVMGSPPSWFSPKSRVRYSDRFIPSRCAVLRRAGVPLRAVGRGTHCIAELGGNANCRLSGNASCWRRAVVAGGWRWC